MNVSQPQSLPDRAVNPVCAECHGRRHGFQIYSATRLKDQKLLAWDVGLALQICSDGRKPILVPTSHVTDMLRVNEINPVHLDHVDPAFPGIVVAVDYTDDRHPVPCLIDGSHRAARSLRDGHAFFCYALSDEESQLCQQTSKVKLFRLVQEQQEKLKEQPECVVEKFDASCPECRSKRDGPEVFTFERFDGRVFVWDIQEARHVCSDGRSALAVLPEHLESILSVNATEAAHLDHVDPLVPGIACACGYAGDQPLMVLIDGSHRAARCRRDHLPFFTHLLTDEESQRCLRGVVA
jgi:hypothetical protein